jgi:hypothetical protein
MEEESSVNAISKRHPENFVVLATAPLMHCRSTILVLFI